MTPTSFAERVDRTVRIVELALRDRARGRAVAAIDRCLARDVVDDDDPLACLPLDDRTRGFLERSGIVSIGQLKRTPDHYLLAIDGVGSDTVTSIKQALRAAEAEANIRSVAEFDRGFFADVDGA